MNEVVFYEDKNGNSDTFDYVTNISQSRQKDEIAIYKKLVHQINMLEMLGEPQS